VYEYAENDCGVVEVQRKLTDYLIVTEMARAGEGEFGTNAHGEAREIERENFGETVY